MSRPKRATRNKRSKNEKKLKNFLLGDEGKIKKKDLAKLGISLAALSSMAQSASGEVEALPIPEGGSCGGCGGLGPATTHSNALQPHNSSLFESGQGGHSSGTPHGSHASHASHGSHSSHNSHGQW